MPTTVLTPAATRVPDTGSSMRLTPPALVAGAAKPATLYTYGYHQGSPADLDAYLDAIAARGEGLPLIVDVRLSPRSHFAGWNRSALLNRYRGQYIHAPYFGNLNYLRPDLGIELANPVLGLVQVQVPAASRPLVLLCVCPRVEMCHRSQVARLLVAELPGTADDTPLTIDHLPAQYARWSGAR